MRLNVCRKAGCAGRDSSSGVFRKGWHVEQESALLGWTPGAVLGYQGRDDQAVHAGLQSLQRGWAKAVNQARQSEGTERLSTSAGERIFTRCSSVC